MVDSGVRQATLGYGMSVCTYTRKDSPFFWLKWGTAAGESKSSGVRLDDSEADYKIAKQINRIEARLLVRNLKSGWDWVPLFFSAVYRNSESTLRVHTNAWKWVTFYLRENEILSPALLTRQQVFAYMDWRMKRQKQKSGKFPCRNTALAEMRVLGRVMNEAVLREMAEKNPAATLGLRRDVPKPKAEILPEQEALILDALEHQPPWMGRAFRIAMQTGLREAETIIDLRRQVDWERARITIDDPKGGTKRAFTFEILQMSLLPYLRSIAARAPMTWTKEEITGPPAGVIWREFFDGLGMPEICFHCTRVTFITWCHRQEIPETIVMQLVNHASTEIHRIYQRLNVSSVRPWRDRVIDPHALRIVSANG